MLTKREIHKFALHNDERVFSEDDLKPFDDMSSEGGVGETRSLCNLRGLATERLVQEKLSKIFNHLEKIEDNSSFAMDLYDPVMHVRVEVKYENKYTKVTINNKFGRDRRIDEDGANLFIYINLGCREMPTIRHYHTNAFIINGRRLTWDLLYGIYLEANAILSSNSDTTLTCMKLIDKVNEKRRFKEAVMRYVKKQKGEVYADLRRQKHEFELALEEVNKLKDTYERKLKELQANPLLGSAPITVSEDIEDIDVSSISPVLDEPDPIESNRSYDIVSLMINSSKAANLTTEMDAFNYLINVAFMQKLLCEYGCVKEYFYNRLVEICTVNNIKTSYNLANILNIFGNKIRRGYRQFIINSNGQRIETRNEAIGYTAAERENVRKNLLAYNELTDISFYFDSPEFCAVKNRAALTAANTSEHVRNMMSSIQVLPPERFVRVDTGEPLTTSIKAKHKRDFLLQLLKSYASLIGYDYPARDDSCIQYTDEHGGITYYNMQSVLKNLYRDDADLYKAINDEWFDLRAYDPTLPIYDKIVRSIEICIRDNVPFRDYRAAFGERGATDLHHKLCELLKNHGKTRKGTINTRFMEDERRNLMQFIAERLDVIKRGNLHIKRNPTTGKNERCIPNEIQTQHQQCQSYHQP